MAAKTDEAHWAQVAQQWIAWARSPQHDAFWAYRDALIEFLGSDAGNALEIGCGEGRISRELRKLGHRVTATDAVAAMVDAARQADSADEYAVAGASDLPFQDKQFDLVMAYNVLMDVDGVPAALREARRVMKPDAVLFISLVHPFRDRGRFAGPEPDAAFILDGTYYGRERFEGEEEYNGLSMRFAGWSQPLQDYMAAWRKRAWQSLRYANPCRTTWLENTCVNGRGYRSLFMWLKIRIL